VAVRLISDEKFLQGPFAAVQKIGMSILQIRVSENAVQKTAMSAHGKDEIVQATPRGMARFAFRNDSKRSMAGYVDPVRIFGINLWQPESFDRVCLLRGIDHCLTKPNLYKSHRRRRHVAPARRRVSPLD